MQTLTKPEEDPIPKIKEIVKAIFPNYNYLITVKGSLLRITINFKSFKDKSHWDYSEPPEDPYDEFHRAPSIDFEIILTKHGRVVIRALWRERIITYELDVDGNGKWLRDDNQTHKPFPDGDEFELLAKELYEIRSELIEKYIKEP